jgi:hypothetical protein
LIRINARESVIGNNAFSLTEVVMPIDSMLVSSAVILMFLVFAGVLAWGEIQTRVTPVTHSQKRRGN